MNVARFTAGLAGAGVAAVAVAVAAYEIHDARAATTELAAATEKRDALAGQIAEVEKKVRLAERRAVEAEMDGGELLKAVESVRRQQEATASAGRVGNPSSEAPAVAGPAAPQRSEAEARPLAQGRIPDQAGIVGGIGGVAVGSSGLSGRAVEEEQERLAHERAYSQELAKKRSEDARARAEIDVAARDLDATGKFNQLIEAAERYAANGEFQAGIRTYNDAMAARPAELPLPDRVRELQAQLQAQNSPVDLTLNSDSETFVSIRNARGPARFQTVTIKILPANYEIRGSRRG